MADLVDGAKIQVQGSTSTYTIERKGAVRSCSCPAWRNQAVPIEQRTCKHLRGYIGDELETARVGAASPAKKIASRPAWLRGDGHREDREIRERRRAVLARVVESFPVVYDKMLLVYNLRMPRHLAFAAGWWLALSTAERGEAWGPFGTGLGGVASWFADGGLDRALLPGMDGRLEDRYRCDPPEMVTVFHGNSDGGHWGLWYDDPAELPRTIVQNYARDSAETSACLPTLLGTLRDELFDRHHSDPEPADRTLLTMVDWLDEVHAEEMAAYRAESISPFVPRPAVTGGLGPWIAGWTPPPELGSESSRYEHYRARAPIVNDWVAAARAALATDPGHALVIARELHWLDADDYRAASTELLVGAYRALGRDALADIARVHHEHRDLKSVGVYAAAPRTPAQLAADALASTDLAVLDALLDSDPGPEVLAGVEAAELHHFAQIASWADVGDMSCADLREPYRVALLRLFERVGLGGRVLEAAYGADPELAGRAIARVDLGWRSERGRTPLHVACRAAWVDGVRALLARGADVHVRDADKQLPWDAARDAWELHRHEAGEIFELLRARGGAPEPAKPAAPTGTWTAGTRVHHAKFGDGKVTSATGLGDDAKLVIAFDGAPKAPKTLLAKFVTRVK